MSSSNVVPNVQFSKILFEGVYNTGSVKVVAVDKTESAGLVDGNAMIIVSTNIVTDKRSQNEAIADQIVAEMISDLNDQPDVVGHRFGVVTLKDAGQTMFPSESQPDQWLVTLTYYGDAIDEPVEQFRYGWWLDLCPESAQQLTLAL